MTRLRIIGRVDGVPTKFDGQYVVEYDPSYWPEGGEYDGGKLIYTGDLAKAKTFADPVEALEYWRQSFGVRPHDGRPNRPLTAFHCEVSNER